MSDEVKKNGQINGQINGHQNNVVLQVLCRAFDQDVSEVMAEWREFYGEGEGWLWYARGLGAFIGGKRRTELAALREQNAALVRDKERLLRFAGMAVIIHADGGEWDGFGLQGDLEKCGLLVQQEMTTPCDPEHCICGEVSDFPVTCYRRTALGIEARDAAMREET